MYNWVCIKGCDLTFKNESVNLSILTLVKANPVRAGNTTMAYGLVHDFESNNLSKLNLLKQGKINSNLAVKTKPRITAQNVVLFITRYTKQ